MYKKIMILALISLFVFVSCSPGAIVSEGVKCPAWTGYESTQTCKLEQSHRGIRAYQDFKLSDYEMVEIKVSQDSILIDNGKNINVYTDLGDKIDYSIMKITPGTYIVSRDKATETASFRMVSPYEGRISNVMLEFAKLEK